MDMKPQITHTNELDRLTSSLLKSTALRHEEVEQIASRGDLFLSVKRRIAAEAREEQRVNTGGALFARPRVIVFASIVSVLTILFTVEAIVNRSNINRKAAQPMAKSSVSPQQPQPEVISSETQPNRNDSRYQTVPVRPSVERPTAIKTVYHPPRPTQTTEPEEQPVEFYALADMNSNESVAGGRVIRVDLPRASLVSLGVNVPLGNDKQLVKADIVVGPDGVPRAIRVVE